MRQKTWPAWGWPAVIIGSALATRLVVLLHVGIVMQPAIVMWFLFICPGMTLVRFFRLQEILIEWILAFALSVAIDGIVASIVLYAGRWSPINILDLLISFCLAGALLQLATLGSHPLKVPLRQRQFLRSGVVRERSTRFNSLRRLLGKD